MNDIKLKRCPFCGGEVVIEDIGEGENDHFYMMACQNKDCNCAVSFGKESEGIDDFVKAWNTRKPIERTIEQLEELKNDADMRAGEYEYEDFDNYEFGKANAFTEAIEVVKKGM